MREKLLTTKQKRLLIKYNLYKPNLTHQQAQSILSNRGKHERDKIKKLRQLYANLSSLEDVSLEEVLLYED
jgi:hypothetical protein